MVLGSVGRGVRTRLETLHQAGLLTVILRSQIPNNSQWCRDWYAPYPGGEVTNSLGPPSGSNRVFRGGSWSFGAALCRSASRFNGVPGYRDYLVGFRLALSAVR
jgi:hypothetical protein